MLISKLKQRDKEYTRSKKEDVYELSSLIIHITITWLRFHLIIYSEYRPTCASGKVLWRHDML